MYGSGSSAKNKRIRHEIIKLLEQQTRVITNAARTVTSSNITNNNVKSSETGAGSPVQSDTDRDITIWTAIGGPIDIPYLVDENAYALLKDNKGEEEINTNYLVNDGDGCILANSSAGGFTITLPPVSTITSKRVIALKLKNTAPLNNVVVNTSSSEPIESTLNGPVTSFTLDVANETWILMKNETNDGWRRLSPLSFVEGDNSFEFRESVNLIASIDTWSQLRPDNSFTSPNSFTFTRLYLEDLDNNDTELFNCVRLNIGTCGPYGSGNNIWLGTSIVLTRINI